MANIIYFSSGFEAGNTSEWTTGTGNETGDGYVTTERSKSGQYSWKAFIQDADGHDNAKLLRWGLNQNDAYYSVWLYWPSDFVVTGVGTQYVNMFQFKELQSPWDPLFVICVHREYYADSDSWVDSFGLHDFKAANIDNTGVKIPKDGWHHLEAHCIVDAADGRLTVYLDGQEIIDKQNINTKGTSTYAGIMWGVGNYGYGTPSGRGKYIYFDDAYVTSERLGATMATHSIDVILRVLELADFAMGATPADLSVQRTKTGTYSVTATAVGGFASAITLTVAGVPANATFSFSKNPILPGETSVFSITPANNTPVGNFTLTFSGNG